MAWERTCSQDLVLFLTVTRAIVFLTPRAFALLLFLFLLCKDLRLEMRQLKTMSSSFFMHQATFDAKKRKDEVEKKCLVDIFRISLQHTDNILSTWGVHNFRLRSCPWKKEARITELQIRLTDWGIDWNKCTCSFRKNVGSPSTVGNILLTIETIPLHSITGSEWLGSALFVAEAGSYKKAGFHYCVAVIYRGRQLSGRHSQVNFWGSRRNQFTTIFGRVRLLELGFLFSRRHLLAN